MRDQGDTRARIQEVALELFTEKGYEATSLREIAERLGVTKAALYYHFKTKDDIVVSFMEDRYATMERLYEWARSQPEITTEVRKEFLRRYSTELREGGHHKIMRFLERNQTALRDHPKSERMRERMMDIFNLLSSKDDPLTTRLKSAMAIFSLHAVWFLIGEEDGPTEEQRQEAALAVAFELIDSGMPRTAPAAPETALA
jgi:AcrR family transcriptional regulator